MKKTFMKCRLLAVFFIFVLLLSSCTKTSYLERKKGEAESGQESGNPLSEGKKTTGGTKTTGEKKSTGGTKSTGGEKTTEGKKTTGSASDGEVRKTWAVHVTGAVKNPGVYQVKEGSRVFEALNLAGGLCENAAADSLNQAEFLQDGQMIRVLTKEEAAQDPPSVTEEEKTGETRLSNGSNSKININRAGKEELMQLPGIGDSKAEAILAWRKEHGNFTSVDDLKAIRGIKDGVLNKIRDRCTVS